MSESEYTKVFEDRPDLRLSAWWLMEPNFMETVIRLMSVDELIAGRTSALLNRDHPNIPKQESFDSRFNYV